jgi:hypothetical protein
MAGTVKFTSHINDWTEETAGKLDVAVLEAVTDIHRVAGIFAPKASRALVNSGRIKRMGLGHYAVIFGGGQVPYARRRHYENKKTPSSIRYLERAGDSTARNFRRYVKGI